MGDLDAIVDFIAEEAREAEGRVLDQETLRRGITTALKDDSIARYWLLVDESDVACGCTSVVKEWSDWNAGFYWWIQSMYIATEHRGKGYLAMLIDRVVEAAEKDGCLDLRLYVHHENPAAMQAYKKVGFNESEYLFMSRPI